MTVSSEPLSDALQIEVWSDVACPFCYIGSRHLDAALEQFDGNAQLTWQPFQLDPSAAVDPDGDLYDLLARKFRVSRDEARKMNGRVRDMATAAGLTMNFDQVVPTNTLDAHRLVALAQGAGLQTQAIEALFRAYFIEGRNIGHADTLIAIGDDIGLDHGAVETMLASDDWTAEVAQRVSDGAQLGLSGVPFIVIDRRYGISEAQPVEAMLQVLETAAAARRGAPRTILIRRSRAAQ